MFQSTTCIECSPCPPPDTYPTGMAMACTPLRILRYPVHASVSTFAGNLWPAWCSVHNHSCGTAACSGLLSVPQEPAYAHHVPSAQYKSITDANLDSDYYSLMHRRCPSLLAMPPCTPWTPCHLPLATCLTLLDPLATTSSPLPPMPSPMPPGPLLLRKIRCVVGCHRPQPNDA